MVLRFGRRLSVIVRQFVAHCAKPVSTAHLIMSAFSRPGAGLAAAAALPVAAAAYSYVAHGYAQLVLGAACTEQLWMQRLEGSVELELRMRPFSSCAEVCGMLSPVLERPRTAGPTNHRAFTIIDTPDRSAHLSERTKERHRQVTERQLPPTMMQRSVQVVAPLPSMSALLRGELFEEMRKFCRKTRDGGTEYFSSPPAGFASSLLPG